MHRAAFALILSVCAAGSAGVAAAATTATAGDAEFAHPHQLVDIGGRRLNLYCSGSGPVTVVFDAEGTNAGWSWHAVQPRVAGRTRACVYDRAGLGFSDPSPLPAISAQVVEDLHALLAKAGIAPPYVLVGNSYGGMNVQLFAYRYPQEVKALVLVEPGSEDEDERMNAASQGKLKQMDAMVDQQMKQCRDAADQSFVLGSEIFAVCTSGTGDVYGRELAAARLAVMSKPAYWHAAIGEIDGFPASAAALKAARRSFGDLPLVMLTRGVSPYAQPGKPQSALNKAFEAENLAIHTEIAALSTRASHHVVADASHIIQNDQPDAVVQAVSEALGRAGY